MLVAGVVLLAQTPFNVGTSLRVAHQLRVRNWIPMAILSLNSVLWAASVLVIYLLGGGLLPLAIAMTATGIVTTTLQAVAAMRVVRPQRPSRRAILRLARVGLPVGLSGLLTLAYARIDQLLVFAIAGSAAAGLYGAEYRIVEQAHLVPVSVMTTLLPILSASWKHDRKRALRISWRAAEYLSVASLGGLATAIVVARPLTVLLFGADFADAAPALPVLAGAFVFICFGYLTGNLVLISGLQRWLVGIGAVAFVLNVGGNAILIPQLGFMGAAWMTLVTEAAVVLATAVLLARRVGLAPPPLSRAARIVAAAAVLAGALALLDLLGVGLAGLLFVAAVAYPALLLGLRAVDLAEVRSLLRERRAA